MKKTGLIASPEPIRSYSYEICKTYEDKMSDYPEKFTLPEKLIPPVYNQGTVEGTLPQIKKDIISIKGETTTAKCYIGDTVPFGDSVVLKSISVYGTEYTTDSDVDGNAGSQGIQFNKDGSYANANVTSEIQPENYGWSINQIHSYGDAGMVTEYRDDTFAIFEVTTNGELNNNPVIGTYVGDGEPERFIDLGFTPSAVEVCLLDGRVTLTTDFEGTTLTMSYGGTALYDKKNSVGYDCIVNETYPVVKIVENGFMVYLTSINETQGILSNSVDVRYYFKAYKSNQFVVIS